MTTKSHKPATSDAEKAHIVAVKARPCCGCGACGPNDAHHPVQDSWGGKRASHWAVISLCKKCHWMLHKQRAKWNALYDKDWLYIQDMLKAIHGDRYSENHWQVGWFVQESSYIMEEFSRCLSPRIDYLFWEAGLTHCRALSSLFHFGDVMRGQYKNARDGNEKEIFGILRGYGIQVYPTDQPLDSICAFKGVNYLCEVKNGPKAKLTKGQVNFIDEWRGQFVILCSEDEAHAWAKSVVSA